MIRIEITIEERKLLLHALSIAGEDGSIYGSAEGAARERIDVALDNLVKKLRNAR